MNSSTKKSISKKQTQPTLFISKECSRRIIQDVRNIMKNPLDEHSIYYIHDEEDILTGYAMIVGGEDTPYFGGYYFFRFRFTSNYPFEPPIVDYCTNDGATRFNPNLYINRKTCLSILNTWRGEQWSACQSISTILLSLSTILCKNPLLNEPNIKSTHRDFDRYTKTIEYANISTALCDVILKTPYLHLSFFDLFEPQIEKHFRKNVEKIETFCKQYTTPEIIIVNVYSMVTRVNYEVVLAKLDLCKLKYQME